jgi:CubicO group peptidase (beta-lactamase class C family)
MTKTHTANSTGNRWRMLGAAAAAVALLATACAATAPANAVARQPWRDFDAYLKQSGFSGTALVAKDGRYLLERGYSAADRTRGVPNTPRTRFCIASLGKMFTAVAIAQLVQEGTLSFADPIANYLSGFPADVAEKVTIADLLTHTSGLGDVALGTSQPPRMLAGVMARIVKEPLQFEPGSRFSYSNDGFIVLGAIIEQVTGLPYADYVRQHIFKPAGMTDTDIRVYSPAEVPRMAHGYVVGDDGQPHDNSEMLEIGNPSGGAYSTVRDLLRFAQALTHYQLLSPTLTNTILAGKVDVHRPGGPAVDMYGYGFADQTINGVRIVGHNGGSPGYEGQLDIYLGKGYVVAVLANQDRVLVPAIQKSEELLTRVPTS